jgi:hypothetical protein
VAASEAAFLLSPANMTKVIDIPEETSVVQRFSDFCDEHDIAVMDREELLEIFENSGPGYALRRWYQMQAECRDW